MAGTNLISILVSSIKSKTVHKENTCYKPVYCTSVGGLFQLMKDLFELSSGESLPSNLSLGESLPNLSLSLDESQYFEF